MIYLPIENFSDYSFYYLLDSETIRVYDTNPIIDTDVPYTDYFINSHYLSKTGIEHISLVPTPLDVNLLTNSVYYRNDFSDILIIFLILCIFCFWLPFQILKRFFKKV